jgi:hypothetical protein
MVVVGSTAVTNIVDNATAQFTTIAGQIAQQSGVPWADVEHAISANQTLTVRTALAMMKGDRSPLRAFVSGARR